MSSMNGSSSRNDGDASTLRPSSPTASNDDVEDVNLGDYSTRMDEIFQDDEDGGSVDDIASNGAFVDDDDEEFVYSGVDAESKGAYQDQLRDILGEEHEEDELSELEADKQLPLNTPNIRLPGYGIRPSADAMSDHTTPSTPSMSHSGEASPTAAASPAHHDASVIGTASGSVSKQSRTFLHPNISRLRSFTPRQSPSPSAGSGASASKRPDGLLSPGLSHPALSGTSSMSHLNDLLAGNHVLTGLPEVEREVFQWTRLRNVEDRIYSKRPVKASAVLGAVDSGAPTVLASNGLICVGTESGRVFVFDFKQTLKCICGLPTSSQTIGAVTAVALSNDHTFVASGHASGYILLYDLKNPSNPARIVKPTSVAMVVAGRQEGHLGGTRIVSVGFIANRHTAIVSADENGLAFYHSLGKVLFVEATDTLRILGKYPEDERGNAIQGSGDITRPGSSPFNSRLRRRRQRHANTILALGPLPLGTAAHITDTYQVVAILTAAKLVVVGLKPTPKTWYRRHRVELEGLDGQHSRWRGCMAWFPSMLEPGALPPKGRSAPPAPSSKPILAYSWGDRIYLLRITESKVKEKVINSRTGKTSEMEVGMLTFEEGRSWSAGGDILALQWLNANQVIVLVADALQVYDIRNGQRLERSGFDLSTLAMPRLDHNLGGAFHYTGAVDDVSHSLRTYKGKIFLLGQSEIRVGSLLTWADRVLHFVESGDFLSAIELTRSYYVGEAEGNKNGLPDDPDAMKKVVGTKMRELMSASVAYAFSEDRLTDATHFTPDGRGVDRTILFEDLAATCARACIALEDHDFLFEDLFHNYDSWGISRIYLQQLERFVLNGTIRRVPPRITQRLVAMHEDDNNAAQAETVIWHIDPDCLDINQSIKLCQRFRLYDALIYVYTRAIRDFVSPVVELLGLLRQVQQYRRARAERLPTPYTDESIEPIVMDGYKIFSYIADILSGLTYPSQEPMPDGEAFQAKREIYTFLFFGRSNVWPSENGSLILTADEEGGPEPTYPYLRLLLRFDAEAFLHALDIAFEDAYLNDETQGVSRLVLVKILLEILATPNFPPTDITLINIFLARNIPKYPQFIQISPSSLHAILIALVEDPDEDSREDRQLAAEYLLSAYTPHQSEEILELFEQAGFYRILRNWHRHELQWSPLFLTYVHDPDLRPSEMFSGIEDTIDAASRREGKKLPSELIETAAEVLSRLLETSIKSTAALLDSRIPELHDNALASASLNDSEKKFAYLRFLLAPPAMDQEQDDLVDTVSPSSPSIHLSKEARLDFITLQCHFEPQNVKASLEHLPRDSLNWDHVVNACEAAGVYGATIWSLNRSHGSRAAIAKASTLGRRILISITENIERDGSAQIPLNGLSALAQESISICRTASLSKSTASISEAEDLWFHLLDTQIKSVQAISSASSGAHKDIISSVRTLVHEIFGAMMSVTGGDNISLPRMFKRLVDSATGPQATKGSAYTEFRTILTGMLEYYRSDGEMLHIARHLIGRDVFASLEELAAARSRGWGPSSGRCQTCQGALTEPAKQIQGSEPTIPGLLAQRIVVVRTGAIYHESCLPLTLSI